MFEGDQREVEGIPETQTRLIAPITIADNQWKQWQIEEHNRRWQEQGKVIGTINAWGSGSRILRRSRIAGFSPAATLAWCWPPFNIYSLHVQNVKGKSTHRIPWEIKHLLILICCLQTCNSAEAFRIRLSTTVLSFGPNRWAQLALGECQTCWNVFVPYGFIKLRIEDGSLARKWTESHKYRGNQTTHNFAKGRLAGNSAIAFK